MYGWIGYLVLEYEYGFVSFTYISRLIYAKAHLVKHRIYARSVYAPIPGHYRKCNLHYDYRITLSQYGALHL